MNKRVFIAGPITRGDMLANVRQADAAFFALLKAGLSPFCPHWSVFAGSVCCWFGGDHVATADSLPQGTTYEQWMGQCAPWVAVSEAVLRLPGDSPGADREAALARSLGIPVFESVEEVVAWSIA